MELRTDATARGEALVAISPREIRLSPGAASGSAGRSAGAASASPGAVSTGAAAGAANASNRGANTLEGVLTAAAVDGDCIRLDVDAGLRLTVHVPREAFAGMGLTVGDTVHAAIDASAVRVP